VSESNKKNWNIYTTYLDTYRSDLDEIDRRQQRIIEDYHDINIDAIVVTDNDALNFMMDIHDDTFPNIPVFFAGINNMDASQFNTSIYSGIMQNTDLTAFNKSLNDQMNQIEKLIVVGANTNTANRIYEELVSMNQHTDFVVEGVLSNDYELIQKQLDQLVTELSAIYVAGSLGYLNHDEFASMIERYTDQPTFVGLSISIVDNVLGGYVVAPAEHGSYITESLDKYFNGEAINNIGIRETPLQKIILNYNAMEKFGMSEKDIPEGAIIINEPSNLLTINKRVFTWIVVSIIFLVVIITFLLYILRSKHLYTLEILHAKKELQETVSKVMNLIVN